MKNEEIPRELVQKIERDVADRLASRHFPPTLNWARNIAAVRFGQSALVTGTATLLGAYFAPDRFFFVVMVITAVVQLGVGGWVIDKANESLKRRSQNN